MQANQQQFQSPCHRGDTVQWALPGGAHLWLHAKPLDATIRRVPAPCCPGSRHGWQFRMKPKNTNKTQLLPIFLMVDRRKKAKKNRDPKQALYSRHWCNELLINVKPHYSSWRAQLHFELSNEVNGLKFKMVLTLNEAQESLWAKYGPLAVKLLRKISYMAWWRIGSVKSLANANVTYLRWKLFGLYTLSTVNMVHVGYEDSV